MASGRVSGTLHTIAAPPTGGGARARSRRSGSRTTISGLTIRTLDTRPSGLTSAEAAERLERHGPNELPRAPRPGWAELVRNQVAQPLIYVLLVAGVVSGLLGEWVEAGVIFGVVVVNATVGVFQERRASAAIQSLLGLVAQHCTVVRDRRRQTVPAREVVPGDFLLLSPGEKVAADADLVRARGLLVDESLLTGESVPAEKVVHGQEGREPEQEDRSARVFAGTFASAGRGEAIVTATGNDTELARIAGLVLATVPLTTPLTRKMAAFGRTVTWAILAVAALTLAIALVRGYDVVDGFLAAVALAVAAIPEGLPAILTIALAVGAHRMASRNAVVRRLPAVETLGSTTVICSDKTGTLTRNEMTVTEAFAGSGFRVSGRGYRPEGSFERDGRPLADRPSELVALLEAALLSSDARLVEDDRTPRVEGDPMEGALVVAAAKATITREEAEASHPRLDELPFEPERRYMATLNRNGGAAAEATVIAKGAPEAVVARCTGQLWPGAWDPDAVLGKAAEMAGRGQRVIAVARKSPAGVESLTDHGALDGLELLGLLGLLDPPREEAVEAVADCRRAGIRVLMITGDHPRTAAAIARQLRIAGSSSAVTGADLDRLDDRGFDAAAARESVFARVAPEHKLRLVSALQRGGEIVAMTGDGVNDAPALRRADIGVAMGVSGTDVSKEAADMVLRDDNFATIAAAVDEGRRVYDNLLKSVVFILPTSAGLSLLVLGAIVLGLTLPILPVQVLWINLVTTVTLALSLSLEAPEADAMARPPRRPDEPMLGRHTLRRIGLVATLMFALGILAFELERSWGMSVDEARTTVVGFVVALEAFYLLGCRSLLRSVRSVGLLGNPAAYLAIAAVGLLQLGFTYLPGLNELFESAPLGAGDWALAAGLAALVAPLVGLDKAWARRAA